ncbi:MAG: hypothetical protein IJ325_03455 [Clostridia bacterium]|nr:hypothetical protein [Clostridia bacterium]
MKIEPLRSYDTPEYPTAEKFRSTDVLTKYIPRRWRYNKWVGKVLLFVVLTGLCSCSLEKGEESGRHTEPHHIAKTGSDTETHHTAETGSDTETAAKRNLVIPLFVHGEGRGSYGCVSIAPPVYLSEDEAAQVIRETALEYGLDFSDRGNVYGEELPYTNIFPGGDKEPGTYEGELPLDGYDAEKQIGFVYVSKNDVVSWHKQGEMMASVESYDMQGTAERLTRTLTDTAVFYDPGSDFNTFMELQNSAGENADWQELSEEYEAMEKARMLEDLRAQVVDFMEWLKGEGII